VAITGYTRARVGNLTRVTVTSGLSGTIYYHWYIDGAWVGSGRSPTRTFHLPADDQVVLVCQDTNDADYDPVAEAPAGWPARRTLYWLRSVDPAIAAYRIEQNRAGAGWVTLGIVRQDGTRWEHQLLTPRLDDLIVYQWRVVPMDAAGNDGTALTIGTETVVRTPDAPAFAATFDEETTQVTLAAA